MMRVKIIFLFILGAMQLKAQVSHQALLTQLELITSSMKSKDLDFTISYHHKLVGNDELIKEDECRYQVAGDKSLVTFTSHETYRSPSEYIRVEFTKQEIIILRDTTVEAQEDVLNSAVNLSQLEAYRLKLDTIKSNLEEQFIIMTNTGGSPYEKLIVKYNKSNNRPQKYSIYYAPNPGFQLQELHLVFNYESNPQVELNSNKYYQLLGSKIKLNPSYQNFNLISN